MLVDLVRQNVGSFGPALARQASGIGYTTAGGGRRTQGWSTTVLGVNSIFFSDSFKLIQQSRDQVRKNPWANAAIDSYLASALGNGIIPHSQHPSADVRKKIQAAWSRSENELDADDILPFTGLQSLIARATLEGGDSFVRLLTDTSDISALVPLKLRVMESEQLPTYYVSMQTVTE